MDHHERQRLGHLMAAMAAGDGAAVFMLYDEFGDRIATVLRRHLARMGVHRVEPDDLHGLVIEACLALHEVAGGWDPHGGALPWTWAERRLAQLASRFVGQHADPLDDDDPPRELAAPSPGMGPHHVDRPVMLTLDELARRDPVVALVRQAAEETLSPRDRAVFLEYRIQHESGDPSPAETVAALFGMTAAAVRQVACRSRRRIMAWLESHGGPTDLALVA